MRLNRSSTLKLSNAHAARIVEVFSSVQGEGFRLGEKQIFVRFGGCNLHCDYCDEPETIPIPSGKVWSIDRIKNRIHHLQAKRKHRSVSWTGGEPLLHSAILSPLMEWTRTQDLQNYLETNGTLPVAMRTVAKLSDVVAMDLKLPSSTGRATWGLHHAFLKEVPRHTFLKVVLTSKSTHTEWRQVLALMRNAPRKMSLILQPATPFGGVEPLSKVQCEEFKKMARPYALRIKIIPQWQHLWDIR